MTRDLQNWSNFKTSILYTCVYATQSAVLLVRVCEKRVKQVILTRIIDVTRIAENYIDDVVVPLTSKYNIEFKDRKLRLIIYQRF